MTGIFPLAAMEKILKNNGAARVSASAKKELKDVLEKEAKKIAEKAFQIAEHAGRTTIKEEDVKLAAE